MEWEAAYCSTHKRYYYFNRQLNVTQWEAPSIAQSPAFPRTLELPSASYTPTAPRPGAGEQGPPACSYMREANEISTGWFYYDPFGHLQGPFSIEALRSFRWHLPMDLLVWYKEEPKYLGRQQQDPEGVSATGCRTSPQQQQQQQQPHLQGNIQGEPETKRLKRMDHNIRLASAERTESTAAEGVDILNSTDGTTASHGAAVSSTPSTFQHPHIAEEELHSNWAVSAKGAPAQAAAPTCGLNGAGGGDAAEAGAQEDDIGFAVELAELLGDGVLLTDWRTCRGQPDCSSSLPGAPPAPVWEHWVLYGAHARAAQHANGAGGLQQQVEQQQQQQQPQEQEGAGDVSDYASAALAGLPPDDEAAVLARLAEASGKSLQELLDFSYANSSACRGTVDPDAFASAAEYNPRRRRLQVAGAEDNIPGSLYRELSSWCNPEQLEQSLQAAASRRGKPLPASVWRQLKERKEEHKKRARTAALLS